MRSIPDFPEPGIIFRDITTVLQDPDGLKLAIDGLKDRLDGVDFDVVVGAESRGFIFGAPLAYEFGKGFVPVRKKGKLPCETVCARYAAPSAVVSMHFGRSARIPAISAWNFISILFALESWPYV